MASRSQPCGLLDEVPPIGKWLGMLPGPRFCRAIVIPPRYHRQVLAFVKLEAALSLIQKLEQVRDQDPHRLVKLKPMERMRLTTFPADILSRPFEEVKAILHDYFIEVLFWTFDTCWEHKTATPKEVAFLRMLIFRHFETFRAIRSRAWAYYHWSSGDKKIIDNASMVTLRPIGSEYYVPPKDADTIIGGQDFNYYVEHDGYTQLFCEESQFVWPEDLHDEEVNSQDIFNAISASDPEAMESLVLLPDTMESLVLLPTDVEPLDAPTFVDVPEPHAADNLNLALSGTAGFADHVPEPLATDSLRLTTTATGCDCHSGSVTVKDFGSADSDSDDDTPVDVSSDSEVEIIDSKPKLCHSDTATVTLADGPCQGNSEPGNKALQLQPAAQALVKSGDDIPRIVAAVAAEVQDVLKSTPRCIFQAPLKRMASVLDLDPEDAQLVELPGLWLGKSTLKRSRRLISSTA